MPNREAAGTRYARGWHRRIPASIHSAGQARCPYGCVVDDEDGKYLAETLRVLSEAEGWAARTSAEAARLRPAPGSSLRGDDDQA
jgi:hypothetical protein